MTRTPFLAHSANSSLNKQVHFGLPLSLDLKASFEVLIDLRIPPASRCRARCGAATCYHPARLLHILAQEVWVIFGSDLCHIRG
jgi:hypothetical protein